MVAVLRTILHARSMRIFAFLLVFFIGLPTAFAAEPISRRDGFLLMWETINRPAEPEWTQFADVPEEAYGSLEIDYAAGRGILDDDSDMFYPDQALRLDTALVWLFRTRNVTDDPDDVTLDTLDEILVRYPIAHLPAEQGDMPLVTQEELERLIQLLNTQLQQEEHEVSLYAEKFHGKGTAFGDTFDMYAFTAAHRSFPSNTLVRVTNVRNGKSVVVRINDRGPYHPGRDMDLSLAAFTAIEDRSQGKFVATFERLGDFRIVDPEQKLTAVASEEPTEETIGSCDGIDATMQQRLGGGVALMRGVPHVFILGETVTLTSAKSFVVRSLRYPDGTSKRVQDFVLPGEAYRLKPSVAGTYEFHVGPAHRQAKIFTMKVVHCDPYNGVN